MARGCRRAGMGTSVLLAAAALLLALPGSAAGPRLLQTVFLASNAGPYNENSLLGVPDEVDTGESFGSGQKVNVCKFQLGDVNNWILKPEIQYTSVVAQAILETSGRGSFIAPAVGFLHYGPSCYLYDHVCNFNYQEPCNLRGDCQTNNTCFCTNGYKTCVPNDGTIISASAGCETYVYGDPNNCGECGNICQSGQVCNGLGSCVASSTPSPPPPPPATNTPPSPSGSTSPSPSTSSGSPSPSSRSPSTSSGSPSPSSGSPSTSSGSPVPVPGSPSPFPTGGAAGGGTGLQTPGSSSTTGVGTPGVGNTGAGPSSSSATGTPSTGASGSSIAGPSQTGSVPSGSNVPANSSPTTGEAPGSSNSPDTGGNILGSTPASSRTHGTAAAGTGAAAEGTRTAAAGTGAAAAGTGAGAATISDSGDVVPGSTAKQAARQAARKAADASAAAGRRLLDLVLHL